MSEEANLSNTPKFKRYVERMREIRKKWLTWFDLDTTHSISKQLTSITWDIMCFKIVDESARLADVSTDGGRQLNGAVFNLLSRSFGKGLMVDIRKLVDKDENCISLKGFLLDAQENYKDMTREAFFAVEDIRAATDQAVDRHEQLDFLCRVSPTNRRPTDHLGIGLFAHLIDLIDHACMDIKIHVDKNIAHAENAATSSPTLNGAPTWGAVYNAHRELCKVAAFVHLYVLGASQLTFSPHPGRTMFSHISRPILLESNVDRVHATLCTYWEDCLEFSDWRPNL
jgi:hypothetical protein